MEPSIEPRSTQQNTSEWAFNGSALTLRESKAYYGRRNADGSCEVWVHEGPRMPLAADGIEESAARDLPLRLDLHNHSPTGFEWGYGGSGPAQLALALLADAVGDEIALVHYQEFKRAFLGGGLGDNWRITADEMRRFVAEQERGGLSTQP